MEAVLELSRREALGPHSGKVTINGNGEPSYVLKQKLNGRLSELDQELKEIDRQIEEFKNLRAKIVAERQDVANQLNTRIGHQPTNLPASTSGSGSARNSAGAGAIDYMNDPFEWTGELKARMRSVFGIHEFRLCQVGYVSNIVALIQLKRQIFPYSVCNANMDGRDIVCVMPTGSVLLCLLMLSQLILYNIF